MSRREEPGSHGGEVTDGGSRLPALISSFFWIGRGDRLRRRRIAGPGLFRVHHHIGVDDGRRNDSFGTAHCIGLLLNSRIDF
jgi:hypothetical protein